MSAPSVSSASRAVARSMQVAYSRLLSKGEIKPGAIPLPTQSLEDARNIPSLLQDFRKRELARHASNSGARVLDNPFLPTSRIIRVVQSRKAAPIDPEDAGSAAAQRVKVTKKVTRWVRPKYSLRRQKELVKAAKAAGLLHFLPAGPKAGAKELEASRRRLKDDIADAKKMRVRAEERISQEKPKGKLRGREAKKRMAEAEKVIAVTTKSLAELHALEKMTTKLKWTVPDKDPGDRKKGLRVLRMYGGRKLKFKGHKWERNLQKRRGQIRVRMRDMRKRIERFKQVYVRKRPRPLLPAKPRKRETLPF